MKTFITYIGGIVFVAGLFIVLGTPDFIGISERIVQFGIGFGLMLTGLIALKLSGCEYME